VTDSGRGPSEEGGGLNASSSGGQSIDCCVVGNARSGGGIRCIPPPPPPASRAPFLPGQWCPPPPPPTVLHHHHHHHHHQSSSGGGSTTLPSRHLKHQPPRQQPALRSALSTVSFSVRKSKSLSTPSASVTGNHFRQHQSNSGQSCATLPPPSTRTSTVRFRGLGSTLEEETDELLQASDSVADVAKSPAETAVPDSSSTMPRSSISGQSKQHVGSATASFDNASPAVTGWSSNGAYLHRDHCGSVGGSSTMAQSSSVNANVTPQHQQQQLHQQQQQQQQAVRAGRSGSGGVVSSCLHGPRSATVQPTAVVPMASKSFDV